MSTNQKRASALPPGLWIVAGSLIEDLDQTLQELQHARREGALFAEEQAIETLAALVAELGRK